MVAFIFYLTREKAKVRPNQVKFRDSKISYRSVCTASLRIQKKYFHVRLLEKPKIAFKKDVITFTSLIKYLPFFGWLQNFGFSMPLFVNSRNFEFWYRDSQFVECSVLRLLVFLGCVFLQNLHSRRLQMFVVFTQKINVTSLEYLFTKKILRILLNF